MLAGIVISAVVLVCVPGDVVKIAGSPFLLAAHDNKRGHVCKTSPRLLVATFPVSYQESLGRD